MSIIGLLKKFGIIFANQLLDHHSICFTWSSFCRWKKLDPRDPTPGWFCVLTDFIENGDLIGGHVPASDSAPGGCLVSICSISKCLIENASGNVVVYTNGLVKSLGSIDAHSSAAAYFPDIDDGMGVRVSGLLLLILTELHTITLALDVVIYFLQKAELSDSLYMSLAKGFVLKNWVADMSYLLGGGSNSKSLVIGLVYDFTKGYRSAMWLPTAKLRVLYEKCDLLSHDKSAIPVVSGLVSL
ncbi:hypothetical protein G9A89_004013 [Geosiphon pyriformis]|nr:hypothetical protein G9A89_004013 [Geosiphon pyriformis]